MAGHRVGDSFLLTSEHAQHITILNPVNSFVNLEENTMSKQYAQQEALRLACEKLALVDLSERCPQLGLAAPEDGVLQLRVLGKNLAVQLSDFTVVINCFQ